MVGVDPLSLAIGGGTAALGTIGGILQSTANNSAQRLNRERLNALLRKQGAGTLGLSPIEERQMQEAYANPARRAAATGKLQAEQLAAANGNAMAGDLERMRNAQAMQVGQAEQQASLATMAADKARKDQQMAEIDQRTAAKAQYKADDLATILGGISKSAATGGAVAGAGSVPGALSWAGNKNTVTPEMANLLSGAQANGLSASDLQTILAEAAKKKTALVPSGAM